MILLWLNLLILRAYLALPQYHQQIITKQLATQCFGVQQLTYRLLDGNNAQFAQNLPYASGLLVYGWYAQKLILSPTDSILVAQLMMQQTNLAGLWYQSTNSFVTQSGNLPPTSTNAPYLASQSWQWFMMSYDFQTGSIQLFSIIPQKGQQPVRYVYTFPQSSPTTLDPYSLQVNLQYSTSQSTQSSCLLFDDLSVSINYPNGQPLDYVDYLSKLGTQMILSFSSLNSTTLTNELPMKADLYYGSKKDTQLNVPSLTQQEVRFSSQSVMYLEDYGQLGMLLSQKKDFSVFVWVKASSNMIQFDYVSVMQPMIESNLAMLALGFQNSGSGHILRCQWGQETQYFDKNIINLLQTWQHVGVVMRTQNGVASAEQYLNGVYQETQTFQYMGSLTDYMSLFLGSTANNLKTVYQQEYFVLRSFQLIKGSFLQTSQTSMCTLEASRDVNPFCVLCNQTLQGGQCVTADQLFPPPQSNLTCNSTQYQVTSRNQSIQSSQQFVQQQVTYQSSSAYSALTQTYPQGMLCTQPQVLLTITQVSFTFTAAAIILQPLIVSSSNQLGFLLDIVPGSVIYSFKVTYTVTCDPQIMVGQASVTVKQNKATQQSIIQLPPGRVVYSNLPVAVTLNSVASQFMDLQITNVAMSSNSSITFTISTASSITSDQQISFTYVIGMRTSLPLQGTSTNPGFSFIQQDKLNVFLGVSGFAYTTPPSTSLSQTTYVTSSNDPRPAQRDPISLYYQMQTSTTANMFPYSALTTQYIESPRATQLQCSNAVHSKMAPYYQYTTLIGANNAISGAGVVNLTIPYKSISPLPPLILFTISRIAFTPKGQIDILLTNVTSKSFGVSVSFQGTSLTNLELKYMPLNAVGESNYIIQQGQSQATVQYLGVYTVPPRVLLSLVGWQAQVKNSAVDVFDNIQVQATAVTTTSFTLQVTTSPNCVISYLRVYYVVMAQSNGFTQNFGMTDFSGKMATIQYGLTPNSFFFSTLVGLQYSESSQLDVLLLDPVVVSDTQINFGTTVQSGSCQNTQFQYIDFLLVPTNANCNQSDPNNSSQCLSCKDQGRQVPLCSCPSGFQDVQGTSCVRCSNARCQSCDSSSCLSCSTGSTLSNCDCTAGYQIDPNSQLCVLLLTYPPPTATLSLSNSYVQGQCNQPNQGGTSAPITLNGNQFTIQAWVNYQNPTTTQQYIPALQWTYQLNNLILVSFSQLAMQVNASGTIQQVFNGLQNHLNSWTWITICVSNVSPFQLKTFVHMPSLNDQITIITPIKQVVFSDTTSTMNVGSSTFCGQVQGVYVWQSFDPFTNPDSLILLSYQQGVSPQLPPQIYLQYSTSAQYWSEQTVMDHSNNNKNTMLGPTTQQDGVQDPFVENLMGFHFNNSAAFIPITNFALPNALTTSFWLRVPSIGTQFSLNNYPSTIFIMRVLSAVPLIFESSKSQTISQYQIALKLAYYSQAANEAGYAVQVCIQKSCCLSRFTIPTNVWQFVSVSYEQMHYFNPEGLPSTRVIIQTPTGQTISVLPVTPYTGSAISDSTYIGLQQATQGTAPPSTTTLNTATLNLYLNQFQMTSGSLVRNAGMGGYGGNAYITSGLSSGVIGLVCASGNTLTYQNECVSPSKSNCNYAKNLGYFYDQDIRQCMQCIQADLTTICTCTDGYYQILDGTCHPCNPNCLTCSNTADGCVTCALSRVNPPPQCICPPGYYSTSSNFTCVPCMMSLCATCSDYSTCLTCAATRTGAPTCKCSPGYYQDSNSACQACNNNFCVTCVTSPTQCTQCVANRTGEPLCACLAGFLNDVTKQTCIPCSGQCQTCAGYLSSCLTCAVNHYGAPTCLCQDGYYDDTNHQCQVCQQQCFDCTKTANGCTSCGHLRVDPPLCFCTTGYFENILGTCEACNAQVCQDCTLNATNCLMCQTPRENEPICLCPAGSYEVPITLLCQKCILNFSFCLACDSSGCLQCQDTFQLVNRQCFQVKSSTSDEGYIAPFNLGDITRFNPCLVAYRERSDLCRICKLGYNIQVSHCVFSCDEGNKPDYDYSFCSNAATNQLIATYDQINSLGLPDQPKWSNPFLLTITMSKIFSPLSPALTLLTQQIYLITMPMYMDVLIPSSTKLVMSTIYSVSPYPHMFYFSFWMLRDYSKEPNMAHQYYLNNINSYVIWSMCGQEITTILLIILFKYFIYLYQRIQAWRTKTGPIKNYHRKRQAEEGALDDDDDNLSVDSHEEDEAENMLNQEPVVEVVAHDNHIQGGEVELQDFDKAYENLPENDATVQESILEKQKLTPDGNNQTLNILSHKRVSTIIAQGTLKNLSPKQSATVKCMMCILKIQLPKIYGELQYTYVLACMMEIAIIPIVFGSLSTIILSGGQIVYIIAGILVYVTQVIYVALLVYICGYRHYSHSWKHLRMFYTQQTYIEWYQQLNNKVYNYTNYRVRLVLMTPALLMVRNIMITSLLVLLRNVPQLALSLAFCVQTVFVLLLILIRPYHHVWLNYLQSFAEALLGTFYMLLLVSHQQILHYSSQSEKYSQIYTSFGYLQSDAPGKQEVYNLGFFMIILIIMYVFCNCMMVGLRTMFVFSRATYNFETLRCKSSQPAKVVATQRTDLEFSSKSNSMLLRDRVPKTNKSEDLPKFWKRMSSNLYVQQVHTQNARNFQRMDLRTSTRIRKIPQYIKWLGLHDMVDVDEQSDDEVSQVRRHFMQDLSLKHFDVIVQLLDSNMDKEDLLIGRQELANFITNELVHSGEFDLMEEPDLIEHRSAQMVSETLEHIREMQQQSQVKAQAVDILNTLRGVIIVSNDYELDDLLLSGLFTIKYFCKRFNEQHNIPELMQKFTVLSESLSNDVMLQIEMSDDIKH